MLWHRSHRADPLARDLADRHYSRQKIGATQFVPPGRCLVLFTETPFGKAYWVTSWPFAEYVKHQWAGAWVCSAFRNEGAALSSDLIKMALAATIAEYGPAPELGMVTFVNSGKVKPKRNPGWCFIRAGFTNAGHTKGGLIALQMAPTNMPAPVPALPPIEDRSKFNLFD